MEELKKPIQVKIAEVEEEVLHSKGKSRAEQKLSADNGAISPTKEQPSLISDSSTHNASRLVSSDTPSGVCAPHNRDVEVTSVADPPTPVASLQSNIKDLATVITNYMLVTNSYRINGRELSASLDGNVLTVYRHGDDIPVMQTRYRNGNWHEEISTQLTTNEIEQIESLRVFTQQALINRSRINWGIEK
ncbi:hypothetical protein AB0758_46460 [Tolypothrix bouteillei VB521301_2]|uniref:hypothetical protein n=1 Tax=Tolypothrix bouteillei TaxID=1246981 RepID=UPI0038B53C12